MTEQEIRDKLREGLVDKVRVLDDLVVYGRSIEIVGVNGSMKLCSPDAFYMKSSEAGLSKKRKIK